MRKEPPPLATWMLEHLTASDRDDALAGDLLEVFSMGAPAKRWYWRQAGAICVLSWRGVCAKRVPLLVFALMWSMAAPAWLLLMNRVGSRLTDGWLWRMSGSAGPLATLIGLAIWTVLNCSFHVGRGGGVRRYPAELWQRNWRKSPAPLNVDDPTDFSSAWRAPRLC